jgi:hypothetical protein
MAGDYELWYRFASRAELLGIEARLAAFRRHPGQKTARGMLSYRQEVSRILAKGGAKPHGVGRALARKVVARLPAVMRRALLPLGLAHPAEVITEAAGSWRLRSVVV